MIRIVDEASRSPLQNALEQLIAVVLDDVL